MLHNYGCLAIIYGIFPIYEEIYSQNLAVFTIWNRLKLLTEHHPKLSQAKSILRTALEILHALVN